MKGRLQLPPIGVHYLQVVIFHRHVGSSMPTTYLQGQEHSPAIAPGRRGRALLPACEPQSRLILRLGAELSRHSTLLSTPSRL